MQRRVNVHFKSTFYIKKFKVFGICNEKMVLPRGIGQGIQKELIQNVLGSSLELVYVLVILIICLFVYFKTREVYKLSEHEGVWFFRNAFLFFGIAYLFLVVSRIVILNSIGVGPRFGIRIIEVLSLIPFSFFSTIAITSLTFSTIWRKIKTTATIKKVLMYLLALVILLLVYFEGTLLSLILTQFALLLIAIVYNFFTHKKSGFSRMFLVYSFMLIFWILNMIVLVGIKIDPLITVLIYIFSTTLFAYVAYRVINITKLGRNGKKKR